MQKKQVKRLQPKTKSGIGKVGKLYREVMNSKPLYPDNATALVAYRKKLDDLAARHGKSVEDYLNEAHSAIPHTPEHMEALQYMRGIGFFLSKLRDGLA